MALSFAEWLDIAVYVPFPSSIVFETLMKSVSENPAFMEPWPPKQQLVKSLDINYMEDEGR